jgi:hypothetical protein
MRKHNRAWIVLDDFNVSTWPGCDLRPVPGQTGCYHYGLLPPRLFESIVRKFSALRRQGQAAHTSRDVQCRPNAISRSVDSPRPIGR